MLSYIDYNFNYRYLIKNIVFQKSFRFCDWSSVPYVKKIILFFSLKNVEIMDSAENFNFFYFFKFFFGRMPEIASLKKKFILGVTSYDYQVELVLEKEDVYDFFFFFNNDIMSLVERDFIFFQKRFFEKSAHFDYLYFRLKDVAIFSEKKDNIGLFDLKTPLSVKFFFNKGLNSVIRILFNNLKFYIL